MGYPNYPDGPPPSRDEGIVIPMPDLPLGRWFQVTTEFRDGELMQQSVVPLADPAERDAVSLPDPPLAEGEAAMRIQPLPAENKVRFTIIRWTDKEGDNTFCLTLSRRRSLELAWTIVKKTLRSFW